MTGWGLVGGSTTHYCRSTDPGEKSRDEGFERLLIENRYSHGHDRPVANLPQSGRWYGVVSRELLLDRDRSVSWIEGR